MTKVERLTYISPVLYTRERSRMLVCSVRSATSTSRSGSKASLSRGAKATESMEPFASMGASS